MKRDTRRGRRHPESAAVDESLRAIEASLADGTPIDLGWLGSGAARGLKKRSPSRPKLAYIARLVAALRPGLVLEVGAGLGTALLLRAGGSSRVVSLDWRKRRTAAVERVVLKVIPGDMGRLAIATLPGTPQRDDLVTILAGLKVDLVVLNLLPGHASDLPDVIRGLLAVARPGTVILVPGMRSRRVRRAVKRCQRDPGSAVIVWQLKIGKRGMAAVIVRTPAVETMVPQLPVGTRMTPDTGPRVHRVRLSHVALDPRFGVVRSIFPPQELSGQTFENVFDATTLFYDVFRSANGEQVIAIGPPFRNLVTSDCPVEFRLAPDGPTLPACRGPADLRPESRNPDRMEIDAPPNATELHVRLGEQAWRVPIQPNLSSSLTGCMALMTMSRNNPLTWIEDWARYHAVNDGVDAVVIFDNGSTAYGVAEIERRLGAVPGLREILVIDQPVTFGILFGGDADTQTVLASQFLQTAMLRLSIDRFLAHADAAINLDVDELLVADDGFLPALLDRPEPVILLPRRPVRAERLRDQELEPRYADAWFETPWFRELRPKWIVQPSHLPVSSIPGIHDVAGADRARDLPDDVFVAHVLDLTADPRKRSRITKATGPITPSPLLQRRLARAFGEEATRS